MVTSTKKNRVKAPLKGKAIAARDLALPFLRERAPQTRLLRHRPRLRTTAPSQRSRQEAPGCSLTDEWIKKWGNILTMQSNSGMKKNAAMPIPRTELNPEVILSSEVSKNQKGKTHTDIHL